MDGGKSLTTVAEGSTSALGRRGPTAAPQLRIPRSGCPRLAGWELLEDPR